MFQSRILCFTNNGIGIDQGQLDKIFGVFHRIHSTTDFEGTGIGLALCKKVVDMHQGKIWVRSEKGIGSNFFVRLPKKWQGR